MDGCHALKYLISPVLGHELEFEAEKGCEFHRSLSILFPSLLLLGSVYQGGLAAREGRNVFVIYFKLACYVVYFNAQNLTIQRRCIATENHGHHAKKKKKKVCKFRPDTISCLPGNEIVKWSLIATTSMHCSSLVSPSLTELKCMRM